MQFLTVTFVSIKPLEEEKIREEYLINIKQQIKKYDIQLNKFNIIEK